MTIQCVEVSADDADLQQSHIRIERQPSGYCIVFGRVTHPDMMGMTDLPSQVCRGREQAIDAAEKKASTFGIAEIWFLV